MRRPLIRRATNLFAAWAYLLAIVLSSASHVHVHALAEASHGHTSGHDSAHPHDCADHSEQHHPGEDHDAAKPCPTPLADDDDCQICQFLGRPILAVTPFALAENSERVVPVRTVTVPRVQPIIVVATHARAPPSVAPVI